MKSKIIVIGTKEKISNVDTYEWNEHFYENFPNLAEYDLIIFYVEKDIIFSKTKDIENMIKERVIYALSKTRITRVIYVGFEKLSNQYNPLYWMQVNKGGVDLRVVENNKDEFVFIESDLKEYFELYYKSINVEYNKEQIIGEQLSYILENNYGKVLAFKKKRNVSELILLPSITDEKNKLKAIKYLLEFYIGWEENYGYLESDEYLAIDEIELINEKNQIVEKYKNETKLIDEKIIEARNNNKYLRNVLSGIGLELHLSCMRLMQEIFKFVKSELKVINIDDEDELKEIDSRKKHDLQINLPDENALKPIKYILINIKGTENKFRQAFLSQMNAHIKTFLKYKKCDIETIHSVAVLNNQPEIDPKQRDPLFGDNNKEVVENIELEEFTVFSSYTLYQIYKHLVREKDKYTEIDVLRFISKKGLLDFNDFVKKD